MSHTPPAPLEGEVPPGHIGIRDGEGITRDASHVVFPILSFIDGTFRLVGTGFFIGPNGIFVSAKHVLNDILDKNGKPIGSLYIYQFLDGNVGVQRPISRFHVHPNADIGVGVCYQMKNNADGTELKNCQLRLTVNIPSNQTKVSTYAYPKILELPKNDKGQQVFDFYPTYFDGLVEEHLPNGRDSSMLPSECFRTSMYLHRGASGGPVFNNNGRVFGVNSTGYDQSNISYVSSIKDILDLNITDVSLVSKEQSKTVRIRDLANGGYVVFDSPL